MARIRPNDLENYKYFVEIPTRWMDNDLYVHVNNAVYYSYFDTAVGHFVVREGKFDLNASPTIGLVVESMCSYFRAISFPDVVQAGISIGKVGTSSVRYDIGLFVGSERSAAAQGYFTHVYVDRISRRPAAIPPGIAAAIQRIL